MALTRTLYSAALGNVFTAANDRSVMAGLHYVEGVLARYGVDPRLSLELTQRAAGPNWSVDIKEGWGAVQGDDAVNQGMYYDFNDATFNYAPAGLGAPVGNPRIDTFVLRVNDSEHTARTPADSAYFDWVIGTPTAGATISNLFGVAALPPSALLLAYVEVRTTDGSIIDARLRDARKLYGPRVQGEDGSHYRLGVTSEGVLGIEKLV